MVLHRAILSVEPERLISCRPISDEDDIDMDDIIVVAALKSKVEAVGREDFIAKTKVTKTKSGKRAIRVSWNNQVSCGSSHMSYFPRSRD